jgi:hypothetical protein
VSTTNVIVNFAGNLKASNNEAPADIAAYSNSVTKAAGLGRCGLPDGGGK